MPPALRRVVVSAFAPPRSIASPAVGIDVSASGIKMAMLSETLHGLVLSSYADVRVPAGAFGEGDSDRLKVAEALKELAREHHFKNANASLPEAQSYLFKTISTGQTKNEWRTEVEQHLDELIPLPPAESAFDIVPVGEAPGGGTLLAGVGYARRVVEENLSLFDEAGIATEALEGEMFAAARAVLSHGDLSTSMIVDLGRTTTKIAIVAKRIPRFATTINIGGHAFTLAVQKYFGVTEEEARRLKIEHGIVSSAGNEEYVAAMLSTVSAIKDEIARRLEYWQKKEVLSNLHEPITRVILVGGNASVRGLSEYLEAALRIPVVTGDVFTNFASRSSWSPPLEHADSLAYGTAIGLALRNYVF